MYCHKDGIWVRKAAREDLPLLLALKAESWWGTHSTLIANMDDQVHWFECMTDREMCIMVMKGDDAVGVGVYTEIDWVSRSMSVSGSIFKEHRTPETVKAAFAAGLDFVFEMLNMRRVGAEVLSCNVVAQRIHLDHLGFKIEGCRREAVYKCGRYYDSILLGLLRTEWEQQGRVLAYGGSCNTTFHPALAERIMQRFSRVNLSAEGVVIPHPMDDPLDQ